MPLDVLLLVALFAPLAGFVVPTVAGGHRSGGGARLSPVGAVVSVACWFLLLVADESASFDRLAPDHLAVAACLGLALLATGILVASGPPVAGAVATALMVGLSMTAPDGGPSMLALTVSVVAAIVLSAVFGDGGGLQLGASPTSAAPAVAAGLLVVGTILLDEQSGSYSLAAVAGARWLTVVFLSAAAVVLLVASTGTTTGASSPASSSSSSSSLASTVLLLPVALALGLRVVPALDGGSVVVVGLALLAVLAAASSSLVPVDPAAGSVALWALVVAILPSASSGEADAGSLLLGAAAVLIVGIGHPLAIVAAVPGGITVAHALAGSIDSWIVLVAICFAATVILLAMQLLSMSAPKFGWYQWALAGLAAWLVLAPHTWTWAGGGSVGRYDESLAIAVGVGLAVAVAVSTASRRGARAASG